MKKIVIFASGSGTNAENIILHFNKKSDVNVVKIITNNPKAKVLERAKKYSIPTEIITKQELEQEELLTNLAEINPDLIVLAGFLLKFPLSILKKFPNKVINIHPALLPKYGGKGMYGMNVHLAILANKELETGITIHYVNEHYDEGEFIFQKNVSISDCLTAEEVAQKVHQLEQKHFPLIIEKLLEK
jgi:phosphoribosylglycinamide formyltransferase-1